MRQLLLGAAIVFCLAPPIEGTAWAQSNSKPRKASKPKRRDVTFIRDRSRRNLHMSVAYDDIVNKRIERKLRRGLPTTILFTGTLFRAGTKRPLSTTAHSCRITWHVWNELYIIEISSPRGTRTVRTLTLKGVLRRCVRFKSRRLSRLLLVGSRSQVPLGAPLYLEGKVRINPLSDEVLRKIKRWLSRPSSTSVPDPGDALFSTFTGLFRKRIEAVERQLEFTTKTVMPKVLPAPKPRKRRRKKK